MGIEKDFRRLIESAIEEHGSVFALTKAAGVQNSNSAVSEWVAGRQKSLNFSTVAKLCDYLGVTLKEHKKKAAKKRKAAKRKSAKRKP